jgi:hypothetical protein
MINANMREYNYFLISAETNSYGQHTLIKNENGEPEIQGTIKMSISIANQTVHDNITYKGANYVGITHDKNVNDRYVIECDGKLLKVQYVTPSRFRIAYLGDYNG